MMIIGLIAEKENFFLEKKNGNKMREQGSNQLTSFRFDCGLGGPRWGLISSQPTIDSFENAAFVLVASRRAVSFGPFIILKFEI